MFGRKTTLPIDVMMGNPPGMSCCPAEYVEWVQDVCAEAYQFAHDQLKAAATGQKTTYDPKFREKQLNKG